MLQEKNIKDALQAYAAGREVFVMSTGDSLMLDKMADFFPGCRFLVDVPATVNQELDQAIPTPREPKSEPDTPPLKDPEVIKPDPVPAKAEPISIPIPPVPIKSMTPDQKREYVKQLQAEGLSNKQISENTGIKYNTVYGYLNPDKCNPKKSKADDLPTPGHNADRHLCKTCRYRSSDRKHGCEYISYTDKARGCSVEDCNKHEKGNPVSRRKTAGFYGE